MRTLILLCFAAASPCLSAATWKVGMNFRSTAGYVTDGPDEVYVLGETVSTTRTTANGNSVTFRWSAQPQERDRSATNVPELAGINFQSNSGPQYTLTITLPQPGQYIVRLALGDAAYSEQYQYLQVLDNTVPLFTLNNVSISAANRFLDAFGTEFTNLTWASGNAPRTVTFTTTACQVVIAPPTPGASNTTLAHFYLEYVPGGRRKVVVVQ